MSVFGKPSYDETRHLMRTVEFRLERTNQLIENGMPFSPENLRLIRDWDGWRERWGVTRERVLSKLLGRKLAQPLLPESMLETSEEFDLVQRAIGRSSDPVSLPALISRFEAATGAKLNEKDAPMPDGFDPDHAAYRAVDTKIKQGEEAAREAAKIGGDVATSNTGLLLLGGLGVLVGGYVAAKVYL